MQQKHASLSFTMIGLLVLTACVPGGPSQGTGERTDGPRAPQAEKTIRIAIGDEPKTWDARVTADPGSPTTGGINNMPPLGQDGVRRTWVGGVYIDLLVAEAPDAARGTWVVKPDGTMEMTWGIVPNAKWHDGIPVTSADFEFAVRVRNDPVASQGRLGAERLLSRVAPIDDHTFVTHWRSVDVTVTDGAGLVPLPKHLLDSVYEQRPQDLGQHRYFTTEFIGTGPFKLVRWEPGSFLEFERFDDYYKGPAKLNRVFLDIIRDANTMMANILAGAVDVLSPPLVGIEQGLEIKERWAREGSRNQVLVETRDGAETWEIMLNPQYARPVNGMTQQPVRQALLQAVDRRELTDTMTVGLSQIAYTFYHQDQYNYRYVRDLIPPQNPRYEYPYDVRRSEQLLAQAGWTKGPDGILVHQPSGERFNYLVQTRRGDEYFRMASIIQNYWKAIGVDLAIEVLTPVNEANNEYLATRTGASLHNAGTGGFQGRRAHSSNIPSPENRWSNNNRGHYSSPVVDRLIERIEVTIDETQARELHRQLLAEQMVDLHSHWWYWVVVPIIMLEGVTGPRNVGSNVIAGNIWEWDYVKS